MSDLNQEYEETIRFLNSLIDFSLIKSLSYSPDKFDLQRVVELLRLMGNPQDTFHVIHVAGTKGKGSTAAMISSVLQAAGYRTGFFYSPFLFDFCEQIQINSTSISMDDLVRQVKIIKKYFPNVDVITTFEQPWQ